MLVQEANFGYGINLSVDNFRKLALSFSVSYVYRLYNEMLKTDIPEYLHSGKKNRAQWSGTHEKLAFQNGPFLKFYVENF